MKSRLLWWVSLGLNLALLAMICHLALRQVVFRPVPREVRLTPSQHPGAAAATETNAVAAVPDPGVEAFTWAQLVSPDFKIYRDRLRAIGCPEATIRDILLAEINEKFRQARAKILAGVQQRYWEVTAKGNDALKAWETPLEKLSEERQALMKEVLGEDSEDQPSDLERQTRSWEKSYAWLPAEKQARLVELELQFQERNRAIWEEIRQRPNNEATAEDRQKLKALQAQQTASREQLLTPEELLEYRLRNTGAGGWARNLSGFEATETEWRAVARLKLEYQEALQHAFPETPGMDEAFARRYGLPASPDSAAAAAQAELRRQMQAELEAATKAALGPARSAEYELAQSSDYQQARRIIERYQLPETLAQQAYELQRTAVTLAQATRNDANLSAEARASALAAIRQETERTLAATLGSKVFNTYQEYHGNWLKQLNQRPGE